MKRQSISIWFTAVVFTLAIVVQLAGCTRGETAQPAAVAAPPAVSVATVVARQIADSDEFTGRFEAVERVEIRPRVSGYIAWEQDFPRNAAMKIRRLVLAGQIAKQLERSAVVPL